MSPMVEYIISFVLMNEKRGMTLHREVVSVDMNKVDIGFFTYFKEDEDYIKGFMSNPPNDLVIVKVDKL